MARSADIRNSRGKAQVIMSTLGLRSQTLIRWRPFAVAGSLLARMGVIDGVALWPTAQRPTVGLDMRDGSSHAWMRPLLPAS